MATRIRWHGKEFKQHLDKVTTEGLLRAGTFYQQKCKEAVSVPNTGVSVPVKRQTAGGNKTSRTIYPNPSKPGEAPRLRTGFGRSNIVINFNRQKRWVRVGITRNALYMFFLEIGTRHIKRRPWLVATLKKYLRTIGALAASGKDVQ